MMWADGSNQLISLVREFLLPTQNSTSCEGGELARARSVAGGASLVWLRQGADWKIASDTGGLSLQVLVAPIADSVGGMATSELGPIEVLYRVADSVLQATQSVLPAHAIADFVDSVRWGEPFILCILAFQFCMLLAVILFRRKPVAQGVLFLVCASVCFSGRWLNEYGSRHWMDFAMQDYFDSQGLFILMFVSGPMVVFANIIVVSGTTALVLYLWSRPM